MERVKKGDCVNLNCLPKEERDDTLVDRAVAEWKFECERTGKTYEQPSVVDCDDRASKETGLTYISLIGTSGPLAKYVYSELTDEMSLVEESDN